MNFTFFRGAHGTFFRIDHILGHKSSLGKFKIIEIIPSIFSGHNEVRLNVNYRRKTIKNINIWRLNNILLNNQHITEEIKKQIKIFIETNENENTTTQNLWDSVKAVLRGRFIAIQAYLKKQERNQINYLTLHLTQLEKEEMKHPRVSRRKEIIKIRAEINVQFSSVAQSCLTICNPMNCSTPGLPVHHQLLESTQTHVHQIGDAIKPSHPLSSPLPPALNLSQHQGLFK